MSLHRADDDSFEMHLQCRDGWAEAFPQSAHLLREEVLAWQKTPWSLVVDGV
jgi:exopolyphosphatase/guanosine-5'-triphosphate,3'-diphosphate pyrophosphatase